MKCFSVVLILVCSSVHAEVIWQPAELNPGDQYRLAFVTSTMGDGSSNDVEDYNAFVQAAADAAPEVGSWGLEWKAIVSTEEVDARDNTDTNLADGIGVPIYRVDGVRLVPNYVFLWEPDDNLQDGISFDITEFGTQLPKTPGQENDAAFVYTGSWIDGTALNLNGLRGYLGSPRPRTGWGTGWANDVSAGWISQGGFNGRTQLSFYAISEVVTVVPEPLAAHILAIGSLSVLGFRKRRR